jgi:pimeloyl-ACP methyl ester carboxylesterase
MPLIVIARIVMAWLGFALLAVAAWLLWTWIRGEPLTDPSGGVVIHREAWRLWTGLALVGWSLGGRWLALLLLARPDAAPARPSRDPGARMVAGTSGSDLYVEEIGAGAAVVLTHGWGLDSTIWRHAKHDLAGFRIVGWDLPGLGRSRLGPDRDVTLEGFAADLAGLIERQNRPVVLVGHSIGGMIIQTLARDRPELFGREVAGVALLNTTYTNPLRTMILSPLARALRPVIEGVLRLAIWLEPLAWLSAWQGYLNGTAHVANRLGFGGAVTRSQLDHTTLLATRNPPGVQARGMLAMFRWDAAGAMAQAACPVMILAGDRDIVTKPEASRAIAASSPRAVLRVMEDANHMGFLEQAPAYDEALADFARTCLAPAEGA